MFLQKAGVPQQSTVIPVVQGRDDKGEKIYSLASLVRATIKGKYRVGLGQSRSRSEFGYTT